MNLFNEEIEQQAIERIQKFAKIARAMGFEVCLGFSGGKDSQVCYDLCKRAGIEFRAFYSVSFESRTTKNFIREYYPDVIWKQDHPFGFIRNIRVHHNGFLPTIHRAYCCADYKHNPKYVEKCSIVGVRKNESAKRKGRTAFEAKNKTVMKQNKALIDDYFEEHCQSIGTASVIQLKPIIDWTENDVWDYIWKHNLPVNPEYKTSKRVGCMVCPKANFSYNVITLMRIPKLIDAFILAREKGLLFTDWKITDNNADYEDDKPYYICRWLNHSFMPFSKKQEILYEKFREKYDNIKRNKDGI